MRVTVDTLNTIMEFDHVIMVREDGTVIDAPAGVYAPEIIDADGTVSQPTGETWELLDGYSGQFSYAGPIMHTSEYIGGGMARDILARPGFYVALTVPGTTFDDDAAFNDPVTSCCERDAADCDCLAGWAVAYREFN